MTNKELISFDEATSLTGKKAIEFFSDKDNVMPLVDQVKKEALSLVPNVSTKKGRDEIGSTALKVSKSRKAITEAIDKSVSDLKAKVQKATDIKKLVVSELDATRKEVLKPRDEWQAEQDRIEEQRVNLIRERINNISSIGAYVESTTKEELAEKIDALESVDVSNGFEEFASEAAQVVSSCIKELNARVLKIIEEERQEEQRKALAVEQHKNEVQLRITSLISIPMNYMGKTKAEIKSKVDSLKNYAVDLDYFGDRSEEVSTNIKNVIAQLEMMMAQAKDEVKLEEPIVLDEPHVEKNNMGTHDRFNNLMYALTKNAARYSFIEFLEENGLSNADYEEVKQYLNEKLGDVKTYC